MKERGTLLKIGEIDYKLSDLDIQKNEIFEELESMRYDSFEDMLYRLQLTYGAIIAILDVKNIPLKR